MVERVTYEQLFRHPALKKQQRGRLTLERANPVLLHQRYAGYAQSLGLSLDEDSELFVPPPPARPEPVPSAGSIEQQAAQARLAALLKHPATHRSRFTQDGQALSAIDLVANAVEKDTNYASKIWTRLVESGVGEPLRSLPTHKFGGQGSRETPLADWATASYILSVLPGPYGKRRRQEEADTAEATEQERLRQEAQAAAHSVRQEQLRREQAQRDEQERRKRAWEREWDPHKHACRLRLCHHLGLPHDCDEEALRRADKAFLRKNHADKNASMSTATQEAFRAYLECRGEYFA
jgi:hypothetical protein